MAERARAVQESFENRQTSTAEALAALLEEVETNETRKKAAGRERLRQVDLVRLTTPN